MEKASQYHYHWDLHQTQSPVSDAVVLAQML